jgi:O-acetyl-ADP-ribose deacetylase (regulator of RNase III)
MSKEIPDPAEPSNKYLNRIKLVRGEIISQKVDAIFSLIPQDLEFSGALNLSLSQASGQDLDAFILDNVYKPAPYDVYAVPGFNLPCRNIIFAVRPNWQEDYERNDKDLVLCVRKALVLAKCMLLTTIAIPPLAGGKKEYGQPRAARLLIQGILDRLDEKIEEVRIVCPDSETIEIYRERLMIKSWRGSPE